MPCVDLCPLACVIDHCQSEPVLVPVILSGGAGTRLWPVSRRAQPKQFLPLVGSSSLFQATLSRLDGLCSPERAVVVCNAEHRFIVASQLQECGGEGASILLEPVGRNTAPAVAVAALEAIRSVGEGTDPVLLVMPADQVIADEESFRAAARRGEQAALAGHLVTFGIVPDGPETGYGYILSGEALDESATSFQVQRFVEKPDRETASSYLAAGGYHWNSGMFMFRCSRYLDELERHEPAMLQAARAAHESMRREHDFGWLDEDSFAASPSNSIDYAVMEHTNAAVVIPISVGWSDVGGWNALHDLGSADADGNVARGDVRTHATSGCYLHSESRLLTTVGVQDLVVVETADAVMVAARDQVGELRDLVGALRNEEREEVVHRSEHLRPWGSFEVLASGEAEGGYKMKRITVRPGHSLSLQMHQQRQEHWVVLAGTAEVTCDDEVITLQPGGSTHIPVGAKHRLRNPGAELLVLAEVQCGEYLGEDDIVRLEDRYGRT